MATTDTVPDEARIQEFVGRFAGDLGAALHQTTVIIGDKLGLYAAMGDCAPVDAGRARRAHRHRRAVRARVAVRAGGQRLRRVRRRLPSASG